MMVLLGYFLIAGITGVAASAMIGLFLTNFIIGRFKAFDRVSPWINVLVSEAKIDAKHRTWRFRCLRRHQTQARMPSVLIRRT